MENEKRRMGLEPMVKRVAAVRLLPLQKIEEALAAWLWSYVKYLRTKAKFVPPRNIFNLSERDERGK